MAVSFFSTASFHSLLLHISKQSIFSLSDPRLSTISYLSFSQAASCSRISTTRSSSSSRFRTRTIFSTGVQVQRKHEFAHGEVAAVAMAGGMDVSHSGGEETGGTMGRCSHPPEMLAKVAYIPPSWASHLQLIPSHFFSLGQARNKLHILCFARASHFLLGYFSLNYLLLLLLICCKERSSQEG
jgi:hypothetical protein